MDTTASLIAIVDLAFKVIKYMNDVKDGGKDRSALHQQVLTVYELLWNLQGDFESHSLAEESRWSEPLRPLFKPGGTIEQLKRVLEEIASKILIAPHGVRGAAKKFRWPFDKEEMPNILTRLRMCTDTISVAFARANLKLGAETNQAVKDIRHAIDSAELDTALRWISPLDFRELQKAGQRRALDGTCEWFFKNQQVRGWCEGRTRSLWCHGIPGAGKTVLATALFQKLQRIHANDNVAVLIAYCSFDDANTHSPTNITSSFLRQLVEKRGRLSEAVRRLYTEHEQAGERSRPTQEKLADTLSKELETFDRTFIIVDGLDEMRDNKPKIELLRTIESLNPLPQLLVTSRPVEAISKWFMEAANEARYQLRSDFSEEYYSTAYCDNCDERGEESDPDDTGDATSVTHDFEMVGDDGGEVSAGDGGTTLPSYHCMNCANRDVCIDCYKRYDRCFGCNGLTKECFKWAWPGTVTIAAHLEDLERYILWRIDSNDNLKALLENARAQAYGLADSIVQRVQEESHKMFLLAKFHMNALEEQVTARDLINALDTLPSNISDIYSSVFSRISSQRLAATLEKLLTIVATARKLLSTEALAHAITVQVGDTGIDELALPDVRHLASMCAGLVEIDTLGYIRLAHETIGDYIAQTGLNSSRSGHGVLAEICLAYLQFSTFASGACDGPDRESLIRERQKQYPLLRYAAIHWGIHVYHAHDHLPAFLKTDLLGRLTNEFLSDRSLVAASTQFMWLDELESSSGWDAEENVHGLHLSAHFGLTAATSALLATGVDVDVEDCLRTTPLMYAAQSGRAEIVHILLHSGADPGRVCRRGKTVLLRAVAQSDAGVVRDIVASPKDVAVNEVDTEYYGFTALILATVQENPEIVKLLLGRDDIDVNAKTLDIHQYSALHWSVIVGEMSIAELLIADKRTNIEAVSTSHRTPLMVAAEYGYGDMLALLVRSGANTDARDSYDGPPLLRAVDYNSLECVRILIEHGVDYKFKDFLGRGILHGCAVNSRSTIMRYLLKSLPDLDPNAQGDGGETPLHDAVNMHSEAVVRVLLEYGARTDIKDKHGKTPLRQARDADLEQLFDLLRSARMKEIEADDLQSRSVSDTNTNDSFEHAKRVNTLAVDDKMSIEAAVRRLNAEELRSYIDQMEPGEARELIGDQTRELLHIALIHRQLENVAVLLDMGADIHGVNSWGFTPLHLAMDVGSYEAAEMLLDRGSDINARDLLNRTPLTFCTSQDFQPELAFLLLRRGATFDAAERDGLVPTLRYAVDCDELEIVKILVEGGVPFRMKDNRQRTPYQQAKRAGHEEIADYLYEQARKEKMTRDDELGNAGPDSQKIQSTDKSGQAIHEDDVIQPSPGPANQSRTPKSTDIAPIEMEAEQMKAKQEQDSKPFDKTSTLGLTQREVVLLGIILGLIAAVCVK